MFPPTPPPRCPLPFPPETSSPRIWRCGVGVWCLGFGVWGLGSGVRNQGLRRGFVFKAHRLLNHSTLGSRVIKNKRELGVREKACTFYPFCSKGRRGLHPPSPRKELLPLLPPHQRCPSTLSSEYSPYQTAKARFSPRLSGQGLEARFPFGSETDVRCSNLVSQNVFVGGFKKVNPPTKSSTYCLLLRIKILS